MGLLSPSAAKPLEGRPALYPRRGGIVGCPGAIEGEADQVGEVAEIGFFDCAGFQAQRQGVRVGGDGDGGDF